MKYHKALTVSIFIFSFIYVLIHCFTESLFNLHLYQYDSAYFQSVGRLWTEGFIPYRDFFDHKGPLLHFINAIAYSTPFPRLTLLIMESINLSTLLICSTAYMSKYTSNKKLIIVNVTTILFALSYLINGGNTTEGWCISIIVLCALPEFDYIIRSEFSDSECLMAHSPYRAFIDGIGFGLISMIIIKNALILAAVLFVVFIIMLKTKQYKNIFINIFAGILGILLTISPFLIYFYINNSLNELFNDVFIFNFSYASGNANGLNNTSPKALLFVLPSFFALMTGLLFTLYKKKFSAFFLFLSSALTLGMCINSASYKHYYIILIPLMIIGMTGFLCLKSTYSINSFFNLLFLLLCSGIILIGSLYLPNQLESYSNSAKRDCKLEIEKMRELISDIPDDEKNTIAVYNIDASLLAFYIANQIDITYNHPYQTEAHSVKDGSIAANAIKYFKTKSPKWIVTSIKNQNREMLQFLSEKYIKVRETDLILDHKMIRDNQHLILYKKIE